MTQKNHNHLPQQIAIAVDLHGVLFRFDYMKFFGLISITIFGIVGINYYLGTVWAIGASIAFLSPVLIVTLSSGYFALSNGYRPIVEYHILSSKRPPIPLIKKGWLWISNFFYPRTSLVQLCWQLRKAGYELILLSDIGPEAFAILEKRYPKTFYCNNNPLFSQTYYPNSPDSNHIQLTPWYPKNAHNFFKKFSHAFMRQYPGFKKIIFIDNNKGNIKRAKRQNADAFITIHFANTKQTKNILKEHIRLA